MINLSKDQIEQLFNLVGNEVPENPTTEDISKILIELEKRISPEYAFLKNTLPGNANVLMVDDLELSLYQLGKVLTNCGYKTCIARSAPEALDYFKKQNFQYVVIDLFLPDSEDGLYLIETVNNSEKAKQDNTKIIVISGSDDKKLIQECFIKGANEFISKSPDWHKRVLQHIGTLESQKYGLILDVLTKIEDKESKIASLTVNNLYKKEVIDILKKEMQILISTGYVNIVLDLGKVKNLELEVLNAIVFAYKQCAAQNGSLKLCASSVDTVNESLSYVFLNNIIPVYKDKETALIQLKKENV